MIKSVTLDSKHKIQLDSSAGWIFVYRSQFGKDILADIMPLIAAVLEMASKAAESAKDANNGIGIEDILTNEEIMDELMLQLTTLELASLINIFWALAKNANDELDPPEEWAKTLEVLPLDIIVPSIGEMLMRSFVSTKNLKRLQENVRKLREALTLTASSSEQSLEA